MRDLATLPKAHLHLHFTGSMRLSTSQTLAQASGIRLPQRLGASQALNLAPDARGWFRFQRLYDAARQVVVGEAALRRVVQEAAEDDAAEGSGRLELQIDPSNYASQVGGLTPALEIVLDQAKLASATTGVEVALVVAASRTRHPLEARTLARLAAKHAGSGPGEVVGFGLSNDELRGETADFAPAFAMARQAGLLAVPHAGELLGADHVRTVIRQLQPDRLGHGVRAYEQPAVLAEVAQRGIAMELCPTSNLALGVFSRPEDFPLEPILQAGVTVALGADDPLIFGSRLVDQYSLMRKVFGLADAELAELARSSVKASRAGPTTVARLLAGIAAWETDQDWLGGQPDPKGGHDPGLDDPS
ncbi:MAG: adenosine deaminase [Micrococcales bacterium]|nr:adenosine deaminase [Micrococcales bacterium]